MLKAMILELIFYIIGYIIFIACNLLLYKMIKNKRVARLLIIVSLILYAAIRYNVGSDYDTYYKQYNNIENYFSSVEEVVTSDIQFAFTLLMFLTKKYIINEFAIFTVVAIMIYPTTVNAIKKYTTNFLESLFLYFSLGFHLVSLNILKQVISMTILLEGFKNIVEKKYFKIIIMTTIMMIFHISAIIPILIFMIAHFIKPTNRKLFISVIVSMLLLVTYKSLLSISIFSRYAIYLTEINKDYFIVIIGAIGYFIFNTILLYMLLRKKEKLIKNNPQNKIILSALILSIPIKVLGIDNFPIYRMSLYIDQFLIFVIPDLLKIQIEEKGIERYKKNYLVYFLIMIMWLIFSIVFLAHNNFYTYTTIFNIE
ncbi:MAG: EpsG family protein [Clostridia bacterium]|nr:EpsG family protein [Clostridia bacterium]